MNRVTISDISNSAQYLKVNNGLGGTTFCDIKDIEIVPRKMVEMIIEKCKKNEEALRPYYGEPFEDGQDVAYTNIRVYAELLLKQFEKDDFSNTEKCLVEPLPFD